jgi:hypothetical protein
MLMKWFYKMLRRRLQNVALDEIPQIAIDGRDDSLPSASMRFSIQQALNGKFIAVQTFKPNPRGSDWTTEYYIVPEGKKVSEALTVLMLMKGADD